MRKDEPHVSLMERYEANVSTDFPEFLVVWCPREDCEDRMFLVHKRSWMRPRFHQKLTGEKIKITGRVCPYCSRPSRIPARFSPPER